MGSAGFTSLLVQLSESKGFLQGILLLIREGSREARSSSSHNESPHLSSSCWGGQKMVL